ncbi:MAG: hypothetical protein JXA21_30010 [Anaerolineae bacterium]|nr:hypothetical protein [Anaerolineae bacterium]
MNQNTFYLDKSTGTFADALAAYGLAQVLDDVLTNAGRHTHEVVLSDQGTAYALTCTPAVDDALLDACAPFTVAPFLQTWDKQAQALKPLPKGMAKIAALVVDYEAEKQRRAEFFEALKQLSAEARLAYFRESDAPDRARLNEPHHHWDIFRAINPGALAGYNKLVELWWEAREPQTFRALLGVLLRLVARTPNDVTGAEAAWAEVVKARGLAKATATALQVYNPHQGKGQNRAKADKLTMGNVDGFWLLEYLKAVGLYAAGMPKTLRGGSKDSKTYVLSPRKLALDKHAAIMQEFRKAMAAAETAVRSDVLAALRYTRVFLNHCEQHQEEDLYAQMMGGHGPRDFVSGFETAFYKNLGNSSATMNIAFIALPGWVRIETPEDVALFADAREGILAEHEAIVRQFDESHSDDFRLLAAYRDFVSGDDLWPFFEFTTAYAGYIIGQRERGQHRVRQFTTTNLRRLFVNIEPKLRKILDTPGFVNIAYAIRQSTVTAQYRRKQQNDRRYDVRYGLNQELARKANYPQDFVAALSEFLHKYNAENAQVMENRPGPYRKSVKTTDIDDIVGLVDEFGAPLICQLLIAYGYARTPREEQSPLDGAPEPDGVEDEALGEEENEEEAE